MPGRSKVFSEKVSCYLSKYRFFAWLWMRVNRGVESTGAFMNKYGWLAILVGRFWAITRPNVPVAFGFSDMPIKRYILFDLAACTIWVIVWSIILHLVSVGYLALKP